MIQRLKRLITDINLFSTLVVQLPLRRYQTAAANAVIQSCLRGAGLDFLWVFPRQSGKDETIAQLCVFLLTLFQRTEASIVHVYPTQQQCQIGITRLEQRLNNALTLGNAWCKAQPPRRGLGSAQVAFFSGHPQTKPEGATANLLLIINETQDQLEHVIERRFTPMRASTNATALFVGTVRTTSDYLWRIKTRLEALQAADGIQRVFLVTPDDIAPENPFYADFVANQIALKGRHHPSVKTELFNEPLDTSQGLFPPRRQQLMRGRHPRLDRPQPGELYLATIDVGGQDEAATAAGAELANPGRDYTVCTVFRVVFPPAFPPVNGGVGGAAPVDGWAGGAAPVDGWAGGAAPVDGGAGGAAPVDGWAGGAAPVDGGAGGAAPVDGWAGGAAPVDGGAGGAAPVDGWAGGAAPVDGWVGGAAPVDGGVGGAAPVDGWAGGAAPVDGGIGGLGIGPGYELVDVMVDQGTRHFQDMPGRPSLFARLVAYLNHWQVSAIVCDASGVGQGIADALSRALHRPILRFDFAGPGKKARLGNDFIALIETGRFKMYASEDSDQWWFYEQVRFCAYQLAEGQPLERALRWGVPPTARTFPPAGEGTAGSLPVHDDRLLSAALVAEADRAYRAGELFLTTGQSTVIRPNQPEETWY